MNIPYRDLRVIDPALKEDLLRAVERVLAHGRIILGPEVEKFENTVAAFCRRKYAVGVGSGTDALYLALRSIDIGPGDEVITTPLSWIATLNAIVLCGATPVFVDISEDLNLNADLIEAAITPRSKAILPVHFTGNMCRMPQIMEIAAQHRLYVIEDAAQAFGARYDGAPAGSFGDLACFSMNPMKVLNGYGESGAVVTDDQHVYGKLCTLRYAGTINKEDCHYPSLNFRIDTLQAAMLLVEIQYLPKKIERLRMIADTLTKGLNDVVECPVTARNVFHTYYSYTILTAQRDALKAHLSANGIETKIQHPILMPRHTAYRERFDCRLPVAERLVDQLLCIPNHGKLSAEEIQYMVNTIRLFVKDRSP